MIKILKINKIIKPFNKKIFVAGDKSLSIRWVLMASLSKKKSIAYFCGDYISSNLDIELTGSTNIEKCFNFFISKAGGELTPQQACGIIGNFCVESGATLNKGDINPMARSGFQNENSFGIAQWNPAKAAGDRFGKLQEFSSRLKLDYRSLDAQLKFVKFELETLPYLGLGQLRNAKTVKKATVVFQDKYERPNKDLAHTNQRLAFAQETFKKLGVGAN